jgi:hypothetical protein
MQTPDSQLEYARNLIQQFRGLEWLANEAKAIKAAIV